METSARRLDDDLSALSELLLRKVHCRRVLLVWRLDRARRGRTTRSDKSEQGS